jgi:hypothetical protein
MRNDRYHVLDRCSFDSHWCFVRYHEKEIGIHSFICAGEKQLPYGAAFLLLCTE